MSEKTKVLYIAGSGRSGTTLLDRLLGQVRGFFSAGELRFIWERGLGDNQLCGCGKPFADCETWSGIIHRAFGDSFNDGQRARDVMDLLSSLTRLRRFPLLRSGALDGRLEELCEDYLRPLYSAISESTGRNIIVDSSKISSYLHIMSKCSFIDLYVVHIVRDPRAVAYSCARKKPRPEIVDRKEHMPQVSSFRSSVLWTLEHCLIQSTGKRLHDTYLVLRYEDVARDPKGAVREVLNLIGVEDDLAFFVGENSADLKINHSVSGNPMRFMTGILEIKCDDEWTRKMRLRDKFVSSLITYPIRRLYGT